VHSIIQWCIAEVHCFTVGRGWGRALGLVQSQEFAALPGLVIQGDMRTFSKGNEIRVQSASDN
jgi:hypothetical protein